MAQQDGAAAQKLRDAVANLPAKRRLRREAKEREIAESRVDFAVASAGQQQ
jgi:hypothetical protein